MKKKRKKLTACALVAVLGLSFAVYPVYAQEEPATEQTDTGELLELDETAVPVENETAGSEPESTTIETEPVTQPETDVVEVPQSSIPEEVQEEQPESESPEFTSEPDTSEDTEEFTDGTEQTEVAENVVPLADNTYNINESAVTIDAETNGECPGHTIIGSSTSNNITVTGGTHDITLSDCSIDVSNIKYKSAFSIENTATVNLTLKGTNTLKSGYYCAGLQVSNNATLIITEESLGNLTAKGGWYGAGIGGGDYGSGGTITINGGIITATGGTKGAGIGSGDDGSSGTITINGGIITATGGDDTGGYEVGIGSGDDGSSGTITINGGNVTADYIRLPRSEDNAVIINGGTVTVDSFYDIRDNSAIKIFIGGSFKVRDNYDLNIGDKHGNDVYLAKIDNLSGVNEVTVDGTKYTRAGDHSDGDGAFYLYLAEWDHMITTPTGTYKAIWNGRDGFTIKQASPTPAVTISKTTASSITLNPLENVDTYGGAEYSLNGTDWQDNNVFENLSANTEYTVYARYKGNDTYAESVAGTLNVSTNRASYTITIPADPNYPLEAGNADSISTISVNQDQPFDLGYNGQVDVKVKKDDKVTDTAELKLTRQNDTENHTITSALLVNGTALGNINTSVAIFKNKSDSSVTVSFEKPTEENIPAGTYNGTITFEVSYSES